MNLNPLLGDTSGAHTLTMAGVRIRFLVSSEESGGQWSFLEYTAPPGFPGPQPHLHRQTTELFYVLEGQLAVTLGERESTLAPGGFVLVPPGSVHSFSNPGTEPVRFLIQMSPGGTEGYFTALSEMVQNAPSWPLPDMRPVTALAERFDTFSPPVSQTGEGGTEA